MRAPRIMRAEDGGVIAEFGIIVPAVILLICAIVDFSRAFHTINNITTVVREGGRFASVHPTPNAAETFDAMERMWLSFGGAALSEQDNFDFSFDETTGEIVVTIENYPFEPITPLAKVIGNQKLITRSATFRWERAGAPPGPTAP